MKKITILIPSYNEEQNLRPLLGRLSALADGTLPIAAEYRRDDLPDMTSFRWEFLFVNDGSSDRTLDLLYELRRDDPRISIVNFSRNFGKETAMLAGMDYSTGDAVVIIDADLQHPVDAIPLMVYWWLQGYDDVYGARISRGRESFLRRRLSLAYYRLLQRSTRIEILQNVGDFRLLDRRVIEAIVSLRETQRYTKGLYCWVGFRKKAIDYNTADRLQGQSSFNFRSLLNLAVEGVTSYTAAPLRISTIMGTIISLLALAYMVYVICKTIFYGEPVTGFPTLLCCILFLGGVQLLSLGIIGEYIGRIFNETKQRPPYIVESHTPADN